MSKEASLPVRLDPESKARLQRAAKAMGVTPSALIRLLVCSFVDEFERCGGQILMPPQWKNSPVSPARRRPGKAVSAR
jgi:hypothetical protein